MFMRLKPWILVVFTVLLCNQSFCLHFLASPEHLQTPAQQDAYLTELLRIENTLKQQLTDYEILVNTVNKNVSALTSLPAIQTQVLETGISAEQLKVQEMSRLLVLPLDKRTWDCKLLTQSETDAINKQISDTQKNIAVLQQKIDAEPDCQRNNEILEQIRLLNIYLDHLVSQVKSNCGSPIPPVAKVVYVPNANNQLYTYGDQGQATYNQNIQNLLNQQYIKIECPPQKPYPQNSQCIACSTQNNEFYDLTKQACVTCPAGQKFSTIDKKCVKPIFSSNTQGSGGNYMGKIPDPVPGAQSCPSSTPYYNGVNCISCLTPSFFDFSDLTCKSCPTGTTFDINSHQCLFKKFNSNAAGVNSCCQSLVIDPNAETCPADKPFFNGKECVVCALPGYFNVQTLICTVCPAGQGFSLIQKKCIESKYLQPTFTNLVSPNVQNYIGTMPPVDPKYEKVTSCPLNSPFWTGSTCIACALPNFFNFDNKQCEICPPETKFDTSVKKCLKLNTSLLNSNMVTINNYAGMVPAFNSQLSTCPTTQPFFDGNRCIACNLPQYVDFASLSCKSCDNGLNFSIDNRQCVYLTPSFFTRPTADNVFFNGNYSTVIKSIEDMKTKFPGIQQCPEASPYFNAQKNTCTGCSGDSPLWDIKYNRCIFCPQHSTFNKDSRICLLNGGVSATVQRMIMNTVGWI